MRYRKKPLVIEAFQLHTESTIPIPQWYFDAIKAGIAKPIVIYAKVEIFTTEGVMTADWGDWIIRGVKGELYPCKPDIFALTYEPETP